MTAYEQNSTENTKKYIKICPKKKKKKEQKRLKNVTKITNQKKILKKQNKMWATTMLSSFFYHLEDW